MFHCSAPPSTLLDGLCEVESDWSSSVRRGRVETPPNRFKYMRVCIDEAVSINGGPQQYRSPNTVVLLRGTPQKSIYP